MDEEKNEEPTVVNPFTQLYDQIADLLATIQDSKGELVDELPPDIEDHLTQLKKEIESFCSNTHDLLSKAGVDDKKLEEMYNSLPPKERRLVNYGNRLKKEVDTLSQGFASGNETNEPKKTEKPIKKKA